MLKSKVKVFDLDDTLYPEIRFVESGFREVSKFLSPIIKISSTRIYDDLIMIFKSNERGKTFNLLLNKYDFYSNGRVNSMIKIYRNHTPDIKLDAKMRNILEKLKDEHLYLVTDGHKIVQQKKIESLNIANYFNKIFITNRYGISKQKPSLYCFEKIIALENIDFKDLVYVGDNPKKDFVALNGVGAQTVQSLLYVKNLPKLPQKYYAKYRIDSTGELLSLFS